MLTCKQTALLVSQSYDRQLSWRERWGMRTHLMFCGACTLFERQMQFLRQATRRFAREHADTDEKVRLSAEALERIAREMDRYR